VSCGRAPQRCLASERPSVLQVQDEFELGRPRDGEVPTHVAVEDLVRSKLSARELTRRRIQDMRKANRLARRWVRYCVPDLQASRTG